MAKQRVLVLLSALFGLALACSSGKESVSNRSSQFVGKDANGQPLGGGKSGGEEGGEPDKHFALLLMSADRLKVPTPPEAFVSLNLERHIARFKDGDLKADAKAGEITGRCLLFAAGQDPLSVKDTKGSPKVRLSNGGRVAASVATGMTPGLCEAFFKEVMTERFASDFFSLHVSFYAVEGR